MALPILLLLLLKQKYRQSIPARFFFMQKKPSKDRNIWLHACSFGEVKALNPIIHALKDQKLLLTTTTNTGYKLALQTFGAQDIQIRYLPFEPFVYLWKFDHLKTLVVIEAEIWLGLFNFAKKIGAHTYLINARISDRSYMQYLKFKLYYQEVFKHIDTILAQGQIDAIRLESLGASNPQVFGNLKIYVPIEPKHLYNKPKRPVIVAGSTHPGEELLILSTFLKLQQIGSNAQLIIAPRHPERFEDVYAMLQGLKAGKISQIGLDEEMDVLLLDLLGDLNSIYRIADVTILCGSFVKVGGHNPLEPAFFGTRLISGPYIFNQYALFDCIQNYLLVQNQTELYEALVNYSSLLPSYILPTKGTLEHLIKDIANG